MNLSNLKPAEGSVKKAKRIARGQGSGKGGTSTKGHKGAKSRSGYKSKRGFEGGQMPLQRRVPKFGFKNINRVEYQSVNLDLIEHLFSELKLEVITPSILCDYGIVNKNDKVKILARGIDDFNSKIEISAHGFSKKAQQAIEDKGGKVIIL